MAAARGAAAALLGAFWAASLPSAAFGALLVRSSVTPVQKVITLLTGLKGEIELDGTSEATSYNEFSCFCKSKTDGLSENIVIGQESIDSDSSTLEETIALKAKQENEVAERSKTQEELAKELDDTKARCTAETAEYEAKTADLDKAITSCEDATTAIHDSMVSGTAFVHVKQAVKKSMAVAEALKLISTGPKWGKVTAFLQSSVNPADPDYKYHVQPVLDMIAQLKNMLMSQKGEAVTELGKLQTSCTDTENDLTGQMSTNSDAISTLTTDIGTSESTIASTRGSLIEHQDLLKDDQLYLKDLTGLCEQRAKDWDQRAQLRAGELKAITDTLALLQGKVSETEVVNERALLQAKQHSKAAPASKPVGSLSFFQGGLDSVHSARGGVRRLEGGDRVSEVASLQEKERVNKALELLRQEGRFLNSPTLTALAVRVSADPFLKVKTLIQKLIERLLSEATNEATKKGFCDTELSKALQDKTFRFEEVMKLNAELRLLEAKKKELELEIVDLDSAITEMNTALGQAASARADEKTENLKNIQTARDGLEAVTEGLMILKTFYKQAAKAEVLVQKKASPVDEDTSGPGFEGAYRGKQEASHGIIGLLEVIKSDFLRTIRETTKAEEKSAAEFVELDRSLQSDISGKSTKKSLDEADLATTDTTIARKMEEMETNMGLVDDALGKVEDLKPMCIDSGMSYTDRVDKRDEEMAALKEALCILGETDPSICLKRRRRRGPKRARRGLGRLLRRLRRARDRQ